MHLRTCALVVALTLTACEGFEIDQKASQTDSGRTAAGSGGDTAAGGAAATAGLQRTPVSTTPPTTRPPTRMDEILELEKHPGVTPTIAQVDVAPGPAYPDLRGTPGPSPAMGPDSAPVKVFVFSDFQCPVCTRVVEPLKEIARVYPEEVQVVFKQSPLHTHQQASAAAAASLAAFRQGKFWEYHDKLFQNQQFLLEPDLVTYAQEVGLDVARFQQDMADPAIREQVIYERQQAETLGARGTPGFFVNGEKIDGWGSYMGLQSMIDRALQAARQIEGVPPGEVAVAATAAAGENGALFAEVMWGRAAE
jgi:protein-disulfide isomerase